MMSNMMESKVKLYIYIFKKLQYKNGEFDNLSVCLISCIFYHTLSTWWSQNNVPVPDYRVLQMGNITFVISKCSDVRTLA
jgi:hypothetical protein